jgi:hypothetical protein
MVVLDWTKAHNVDNPITSKAQDSPLLSQAKAYEIYFCHPMILPKYTCPLLR